MTTPFSAGPQALGYLYQVRYSLFSLLTDDREEASLIIEGLDDISISGDGLLTLDQLKHHVKGFANLTNSSPEIWKTLRVWSQSLLNEDWQPEDVSLNLITTAEAPINTVAAFLRKTGDRNEDKALELLRSISNESDNANLASSFKVFKALSPQQQRRLIRAITIIDGSQNISDIVNDIKRKLRLSVSPSHIDALYERLEGWWFNKAIDHIVNESKTPISQSELFIKNISISEQIHKDSLPIDYTLAVAPDEYFTDLDNRIFVRQLNYLKLNSKRIRNAVLDYYRAFEQRSRWARESLLIDDELIFYEARLHQEWDRYMTILQDDYDELDSHINCQKFGKSILAWMESIDLPIRPKMPVGSEYVTRGSFHILADQNPPSVYWHPKFIEFLDTIIEMK